MDFRIKLQLHPHALASVVIVSGKYGSHLGWTIDPVKCKKSNGLQRYAAEDPRDTDSVHVATGGLHFQSFHLVEQPRDFHHGAVR